MRCTRWGITYPGFDICRKFTVWQTDCERLKFMCYTDPDNCHMRFLIVVVFIKRPIGAMPGRSASGVTRIPPWHAATRTGWDG